MSSIQTHTSVTVPTARPWTDVIAGMRAMLPWFAGIVPYGLVIGVTAARAGLPSFAGWATGPLIFTGSAQVAVIELLGKGTPASVVIITALIINLRLVLYSAAMAPHWRTRPRWWQATAAYLLVDPSVAVGMVGYDQHESDHRRGDHFYLGGAAALWAVWLIAIVVGGTAGTQLPSALRLEFIIPLFLAGEVAARVATRPAMWAAASAGTVALCATHAPLRSGPLLAMVVGVVAALVAEGKRS